MQPRNTGGFLRAIAIFKLTKGILLVAVAVGLLHLVNKDLEDVATVWIERLHVDPENHIVGGFLEHIGFITPKQLKEASGFSLFYAAIFLTEGTGLLFKKRWAEYFTVIATGSLIPIELYEIFHHFRVFKLVLLALNVAIVWFLIHTVRTDKQGLSA